MPTSRACPPDMISGKEEDAVPTDFFGWRRCFVSSVSTGRIITTVVSKVLLTVPQARYNTIRIS